MRTGASSVSGSVTGVSIPAIFASSVQPGSAGSTSHVQSRTKSSPSTFAVNEESFVMFGVMVVETLCSIVGVEMMTSYVSPGVRPSKVTDGVETICVSE